MAKYKAKPLSFSTTIRNPGRIPNFLKCISPFEGEILTSDIIHEVVKTLIREKEYTPYYVNQSPELKRIRVADDAFFSDYQVEKIIEMSPQKHKEAGFNIGWDSRFDTWYKMIKEFGFIQYSMGEPIVITPTGKMLVEAFLEEPSNEQKIQKVFLNALMKYQTNNPLRRNLNENAPLPLLLKVIKLFNEDPNESNAGLARHELPILICWRNNNAVEAYNYIKSIRNSVGFSCSDEYIYEKCLSLLGNDNRKYLKMEKICHEAVDDYIRKMRMSGLLSLRGNGRFLDINSFELESANYVIEHYSEYPKFENEKEYIEYMGIVDNVIIQIENKSQFDCSDVRLNTLHKYAEEMSKEEVQEELLMLSKRKESIHPVLKYINAPTRLEFLTSIVLVQSFKGLEVNPNYAVDDEGLPTFTASGGLADIECFDADYDSYFEVTLMCGRSDQVNNEIIPISRHLRQAKEQRKAKSFSVFIAPVIHEDTIEAAEWQKHRNDVDIKPFTIVDFVEKIQEYSKVSQFLNLN